MEMVSEFVDPLWRLQERPLMLVRFVLTREEAIDAAVRRHWSRVDLFWTDGHWRVFNAPIDAISAEFRKIMASQVAA